MEKTQDHPHPFQTFKQCVRVHVAAPLYIGPVVVLNYIWQLCDKCLLLTACLKYQQPTLDLVTFVNSALKWAALIFIDDCNDLIVLTFARNSRREAEICYKDTSTQTPAHPPAHWVFPPRWDFSVCLAFNWVSNAIALVRRPPAWSSCSLVLIKAPPPSALLWQLWYCLSRWMSGLISNR